MITNSTEQYMKKLLVAVLIVCSCGGSQVAEEAVPTTLSTTTTSSTTTTTTPEEPEFITGSDLIIGDCFDLLEEGNLYYFLNDQEFVKLPCNVEHSFEIITSINYQSTDETEFNNDGIPNLEIYDKCVDSYFDTYGREIGGTSTFISWLGEVSDFTVDKEYKCLVGVFDYVNGPTYLTITYENYLYQKKSTLIQKNLYSLGEGDCFWNRSYDVEFTYYQTVDVTSCSDVHSQEVIKIHKYPEDLTAKDEIEIWSFKVCESLEANYKVLTYLLDEYEDLDLHIDYVFDDIAFELGDQNEVYCVAQLKYGETMWHKNDSLVSNFKTSIKDFENPFEDGSTVRLSCPTEEEFLGKETTSSHIISLEIENRPIQSIELIYNENEVQYTADLTSGHQINDFLNLSYSVSLYDSLFIFILSNRNIENLESFFEGTFIKTLKLKVIDNLGEIYENNCS